MDDDELEQLEQKLEQLKTEHTDLDSIIDQLIADPPYNELQVQRLKKRKLWLKDEINRIENLIIPDILA